MAETRKRRQKAPKRSDKKLARLSVRLTEEQKSEHDAERKRRGYRSLSAYIEDLLARSADAEQVLARALGTPSARAVALITSRLLTMIESWSGETWRDSAYVAAAAASGMRKVISELGASGELRIPDRLKESRTTSETGEWMDDPRAFGEWGAFQILTALRLSTRVPHAARISTPGIEFERDAAGRVRGLKRGPSGDLDLSDVRMYEYDLSPEYDFWEQIARDLHLSK